VNVPVRNDFWVAGDFVITLQTGATQEVLRLVHSPDEASCFGSSTAETIREFVDRRVNSRPGKNPPVIFEVEASTRPQGLWIVHGIQEVEIDSES